MDCSTLSRAKGQAHTRSAKPSKATPGRNAPRRTAAAVSVRRRKCPKANNLTFFCTLLTAVTSSGAAGMLENTPAHGLWALDKVRSCWSWRAGATSTTGHALWKAQEQRAAHPRHMEELTKIRCQCHHVH
jgi:hypothetical protein